MTDPQPRDPDYARRCRDSFYRQKIMQAMEAEMPVIQPGYCEVELPCRPELTQHLGTIHAGVFATIAGNAGAYAAFSLAPPGTEIVGVEFKINFLGAAASGRLKAVGRAVDVGETIAVSSVEVFAVEQGRDRLVARMQQTMMLADETQMRPQQTESPSP